jgi:UDP-N-acetylmuramoyl-tripeptide--D-alanyl-D-alanine ligase
MEVVERADGLVVVNDAYNANPESTEAALRALVAMSAGHRTWAVLGEMRELGEGAAAAHREVGRLAAELSISQIVTVGDASTAIAAGARGVRGWSGTVASVATIDDALRLLSRELDSADVVLVKASRAAGLDRLAAALVEDVAT